MRALVPAAFHHPPQFGCEGWMCWPWRTPALRYVQYSHGRWFITERNCAGEYLYWYKTTVSQNCTRGRSSMTYLNHDHRKRKNVRLLAKCSLCQDLWRSPSRGVTTSMCGALDGIQVLSDCGEAEVRDERITRVVHKDIWLAGCQCGGKKKTQSSRIPP